MDKDSNSLDSRKLKLAKRYESLIILTPDDSQYKSILKNSTTSSLSQNSNINNTDNLSSKKNTNLKNQTKCMIL